MARNIQSQSGREATGKAFFGLLANALFWLIVAIMLPAQAILGSIPELAPYARWAPIVLYGLAFWSFIRALRLLPRLAASRSIRSLQPRGPKATHPQQQQSRAAPAKTKSGLPVNRTPTVQRMR